MNKKRGTYDDNLTVGNGELAGAILKWVVLCVVAVIIFWNLPVFLVYAGHNVVVLRFGSLDRTETQGIHFKVPFVEKVIDMDIRTQKEQVEATAASNDLQNVNATIAVNYNLNEGSAGKIYSSVGVDYKTVIIDPAIQEAVKASTAKYTAEQLITKREEVREDIKDLLKARLISQGIQVTEVSIVNFKFSDSFESAIEAKVTAEQQALQAKNKLEQSKYEADQAIATARGQAEAIRIQAEAIHNQGGAEYVELQAINKWKGDLPQYLGGSSPIPFLNIK